MFALSIRPMYGELKYAEHLEEHERVEKNEKTLMSESKLYRRKIFFRRYSGKVLPRSST